MSNQIIVPSLGESVTEATVSKWLKQVGEKVDSDEPLVELETDKVNLEVPSPVTGILNKINSKDGSIVEVGALLGVVNEGKTTSTKIKKTELSDQDQETYVPPKNIEKKNIEIDEKTLLEKTFSSREKKQIVIKKMITTLK